MHAVYISIGMSSTLFSSFELCRRLALAGHRVTYLSQAPVEDQVRAQGHDFVSLAQDREIRRLLENADRLSPWRRAAERRRIQRRSMAATELKQTVRSLKPDVLLIDIEMHLAILATASLAIPTALMMVWFSVFRRPGIPPLHCPGSPESSIRGRLRVAGQWLRLHLENRHMYWRQRLQRRLAGELWPAVYYDSVNLHQLRAGARFLGFDLGSQTSRRHWLRPWIYTRLPILSSTAHQLDFADALEQSPANLFYVGPLVFRDRCPAPQEEPDHQAWRRFSTERCRGEAPARPLVYASLGTYWSADQEFLMRIVEVFRRRTDWDLVIGLGGRLKPDTLGRLPDNVLALEFAPQVEVLSQADAAITHGGIGTLNECLLCAVPMVVYSTGFVDQDGCAARMAFHRLALLGDKHRDDSARLEQLLDRAVNDPDLRQRSQRVAQRLEAYPRQGVAVRLIEELAAGQSIEQLARLKAGTTIDSPNRRSDPPNGERP